MKSTSKSRPITCTLSFGVGILLAVSWALPAGATPYAEAVVDSLVLPGNAGNTQTDPAQALGPPDEVEVSLGGPGGFVVLDMGEQSPVIDGPGPDLEVREAGAAAGGADEDYLILLSNSTNPASFVELGIGRAIALVDMAPTGLSTARYVRIEDLSTDTLSSQTPGSDIDSLTVLHGGGLPPGPLDLVARVTGQGVLLSWTSPDPQAVTAFHVRRSLDGFTFGSTPYAELDSVESGFHDTSLPDVTNLWYAVSALTGSVESAAAVVEVTAYALAATPTGSVHLGDDVIGDWELPDPTNRVDLSVTLAGFANGPTAKLALEVFDVDYGNSPILVNGVDIGDLPTHSSESWAPRSRVFAAGVLRPGMNTITFFPRNSGGGTTGELDDFMIRNARLRLFGEAGGVASELPWVVGYTPTMSPPAWEVISEPIRWQENSASTTGFFRLQYPDAQ